IGRGRYLGGGRDRLYQPGGAASCASLCRLRPPPRIAAGDPGRRAAAAVRRYRRAVSAYQSGIAPGRLHQPLGHALLLLAGDAHPEGGAMTLLTAENISVRRGGKTILREVSLQAHAGEFIA